jgi:cytochrome c553
MKRALFLVLVAITTMSVMMAGSTPTPLTTLSGDVLGAHIVYGRGCIACHAPHSGAAGNGIATKSVDGNTYDSALWGEDLTPLYNQTLTFAGGRAVTLPANTAAGPHDPTVVIMLCLSCHDGNIATGGHLVGHTVESLPAPFSGNPTTFLGNDGTTAGNYQNDHPVGINTQFSCTGSYNWDCTLSGATVQMTGPNSSAFVKNYGFAVSLGSYQATPTSTAVPVVTCTSCHNQHSQNVYLGKMFGGTTSQPWQTSFFLRGYYNPSPTSNSAAQFCRQCHGGESNEATGLYNIGTT